MIYVVQRGDTLAKIAGKLLDPSLGLTYKDVAGWNAIADPNVISAGQRLDIPESVLRPEIVFDGLVVPGLQTGTAKAQVPAPQPFGPPPTPRPTPQDKPEATIFGIKATYVMIGGAAILLALLLAGRKG